MGTSVYTVNKAINKPVEFRGLKAQYIWYLGGGVLALLMVFAIMYFIGISTYICLGIVAAIGPALFIRVYRMSHKYGQHGMMKKIAKRSIPKRIKNNTTRTFTDLIVRRGQ